MKTLTKLTFILLFILAYNSNAQSFSNALDYLEFLGNEEETVTKNMWKYTKAVAHSKSDRSINSKRTVLIKSVERAIAKVEKAEGYKGDDYKNKVLEHMRLNESLLKQDYAKIIDLKEVAEQSYDYMEAYILAQELADKKMAEAQAIYEKDFYAFAAENNINIIESETDLGKKMDISNKVFNHNNKMHLIFFKVYINEIYLWEAVEKGDVNGIQQNASALNQTAKEGLELLKAVELYKNDAAIVTATKDVFEFFIDESENEIPKITDFLVLNSDFETIKEALDKTPERKRTKEQIDAYNKKIKEINKSVKTYNTVNTKLNTERQKHLTRLETTKSNFLERHIPND